MVRVVRLMSGGQELFESQPRLCSWDQLPEQAKRLWEENAKRYNENVKRYAKPEPL